MDSKRSTMTEQWVPVAGGEVRVRRFRPSAGSGTPVLLVHGAFLNGHLWDGMIEALEASSQLLDLIAADLPIGAHLRPMNTGTEVTIPSLVAILIGVLDALGVNRAVVAANDSGGAITQHLIVAHPERFSGVLLTSTETADNFPPRYFRFLFPPLRLRAVMWLTCQLLRTNLGRRLPFTFGHLIKRQLPTPEARTLMGALWSSRGARSDLRLFLKGADPAAMKRAEAKFDTFASPVDVAWSAEDRIFPDLDASLLASSFPAGRRVADIFDAGSVSPLDQPEQVANRLLALVERTTSQ